MKPTLILFILSLYCSFLFLYRLGEADLTASHEARAAQDAQTIVSDGGWGLPRLYDRKIELQKPPLYYWLVAVFAELNDGTVNAWTVRLPAALSALGCVLLLVFWGWRSGRLMTGFLAAFILTTCVHFTWLARVGRIDMPLTFMVTLAVVSFSLAEMRRTQISRAWPYAAVGYIAMALGVLLKGPIALVFVGSILVLEIAAQGLGRPALQWKKTTLWWGLPLTALTAAPWFLWANAQTNNQVWEVFFWYHNLERGLGGSGVLQEYPWWYYGPRLAVDLLPWSLVLPAAIWFAWRWGMRADAGARLGGAWFVGVVGLLSLMSFKRADYLLPAYPGAALFLGSVGETWWRRQSVLEDLTPRTRWARPWAWVGMLGVLYGVGWGCFITFTQSRPTEGWPYERIAQTIRAETKMPVIFFRSESHVLAFHVGRPLDTILEWENLDWWATRPEPIFIVMPPDCAEVWASRLVKGRLIEVLRSNDYGVDKHDHPFVVMKSVVSSP